MRKITAILILVTLLFTAACGAKGTETAKSEPVKILSPEEVPDAADLVSADFADPVTEWEAFDSLILSAQKETDTAKRAELLREAENLLLSTYAVIPAYCESSTGVVKDYVENLIVTNNAIHILSYLRMTNGSRTFRACIGGEPGHLDPALLSVSTEFDYAGILYSGLYMPTGDDFVECLAESMTLADDGVTYTVRLREGLKWSDGTPLTAGDFVYAWNRIVDPLTAAEYDYFYSIFDGYDERKLNVSAPDDRTLRFVLKGPCPYIKSLLSNSCFCPMKQEAVEAEEGWESEPGAWCSEAGFVTSGAFVLTEWKHDMYMVLEKNPYYWDSENVSIERIELMLNTDAISGFAAYEAGDIDFTRSIPKDELAGLIREGSSELVQVPLIATSYFAFNVHSDLFDGKTAEEACLMRKAFALLIDRVFITENIFRDGSLPSSYMVPYGMQDGNGGVFHRTGEKGFLDERAIHDHYKETLAEARMYLQAAGYSFDSDDGKLSDDTPLILEIYTFNDASVAEAVQQDLAALGIQSVIRTEHSMLFYEELIKGNYDLTFTGWYADYDDPMCMIDMFMSDASDNYPQFGQ